MTPRRETSPGTNSTPGIGLTFLRLIFGDALGLAVGSSESVDGGGLDDSSFDRGQRKLSIVLESWDVVQVSGEQPTRFRDYERYKIEVGEYKVPLSEVPTRGVWMWEGAYASCTNDALHNGHVDYARSGADDILRTPYMHTT